MSDIFSSDIKCSCLNAKKEVHRTSENKNFITLFNQSQKLWEFLLGRFEFSRFSVKNGCWFTRVECLWGSGDYPKAFPFWCKFWSISFEDAFGFFVQGFSEKVSISYYTLYMRNWRSVSGLKNLWFCTVSTLKCVVA